MTPQEYRQEAILLIEGIDCEPNREKALEYFRKGAEGKDIISAVNLGAAAFDEEDYEQALEWMDKGVEWYKADPQEDAKDYIAFAYARIGDIYFYNFLERDPVPDFFRQYACINYTEAHLMGNSEVCNDLGQCLYEDEWMPGCKADIKGALEVWKEGMEAGSHICALRYCAHFIDTDNVDQEIIDILEGLVRDEEDPCADACALLYQYYSREGNEDLAAEWMECGLDMGSSLMQSIVDEEREEEVGEDSWTASDSNGAGCVIVVDTDGCFRIVNADASDWERLPAIIDADRTDNMRCEKFRNVSRSLGLKGTLLGLLDRDAFRKPDLELNWHASQWYDGMADLAGDMIICMEDGRYNPFSFANEAEAQRVIDALRG